MGRKVAGCRTVLSSRGGESRGGSKLQCDSLVDDSASAGVFFRICRQRFSHHSGSVDKAALLIKSCELLWFKTKKAHLQQLFTVIGECVTAGQPCWLPKVSAPKFLLQNAIINVVMVLTTFSAKAVCDGINLEFDGCSELFIIIQYSWFSYSANCLVNNHVECDTLLSSLINRCDPYRHGCWGSHELVEVVKASWLKASSRTMIVVSPDESHGWTLRMSVLNAAIHDTTMQMILYAAVPNSFSHQCCC